MRRVAGQVKPGPKPSFAIETKADQRPLLIDQPEENLDPQSVF